MFKFIKKIFGTFGVLIFHLLQLFGISIAVFFVFFLIVDFLEDGFTESLKINWGILILTVIWIYVIINNYKAFYNDPEA